MEGQRVATQHLYPRLLCILYVVVVFNAYLYVLFDSYEMYFLTNFVLVA